MLLFTATNRNALISRHIFRDGLNRLAGSRFRLFSQQNPALHTVVHDDFCIEIGPVECFEICKLEDGVQH